MIHKREQEKSGHTYKRRNYGRAEKNRVGSEISQHTIME
jgi:hypothetical protein